MIISLSPEEWNQICLILKKYLHTFQFSFFGSRVKGTHRPTSDLDLCYKIKLNSSINKNINSSKISILIADLEKELEDSLLAFKVDLVNFDECSPDFKQKISISEVPFAGYDPKLSGNC